MDSFVRTSKKELSQRKLEEYDKLELILREGRKDPVWFQEEFFGIKLADDQKLVEMESWYRRFVLWLCHRGWGKTTEAGCYLMAKTLLIPNSKWYIVTNSAGQSIEVFKKIEDIALQRIPSFKTVTDLFAAEVERDRPSDTGFKHNPASHTFRLYNGSELATLSSNLTTIRGKRGNVFFDETGWQTAEQMAATEHFATVDSDFKLGTEKITTYDPTEFPLQLLYASSASDVEFPFFGKYVSFSKKMLIGDPNYYVADMNVESTLHHSYVDGELSRPRVTEESVTKALEDDPELAERELYNRFRKGAGQNAVVRPDVIVRNSTLRAPMLHNPDGKTKFIFCYDPARNFDGSVLSIFRVIDDKAVGYKLAIEDSVSMIDRESRNKTPLPMPAQLDIIRQKMLDYNGERAAEWENIEFYIDAGSGGGGISAVADQLLADWTDKAGNKHHGIIDPVHPQYETARRQYTEARPILHLLDPQKYKRIIYDALEKMAKLDLIGFTSYDGKEMLLFDGKDGEVEPYMLSGKEQLALAGIELLKNEVVYMCRFETPNGGVMYELTKEKKNKMHDDRASNVWALAA